MLRYDHVFNADVTKPYHIHVLESDTSSITVNLNGLFVCYVSSTIGTKYSFSKFNQLESTILQLLVSGSTASYTKKTDQLIFNSLRAKYIKEPGGKFLARNNENGKYFWSTETRTVFFFNPFFFKSEFLWEYTLGYIPSKQQVINIWDKDAASELFL